MRAIARVDRTVQSTLESLIAQNLRGTLVVDAAGRPLGYVTLSALQQAVRAGRGSQFLQELQLKSVPLLAQEGESLAAHLLRLYRDQAPSTPVAVVNEEGTLQEVLTSSQVARRCIEALEEKLGEAQERTHQFSLILELISDMITVSDINGVITWANGAAEVIFGRPVRELLGLSVFDLERLGVVSRSSTALVLKTGQRQSLIQETKTGRRLMVTSSPVFSDKGELQRIINISRDVTEVSRLQDQLRQTEVTAESYRQKLVELQPPRGGGRAYVARSGPMQKISELIRQVAGVNTTVLITGESGSGKELIARKLHDLSPRAAGPFIRINCGAIPDTLLESELFGYAPGAFTGAAKGGKPGLIEMANGGTLFLDEVGELPLSLQVKLLRVIQERELQPVGGTRPIRVDFRLVTATNRDLEEMVAAGKFRADLYYRINVVPVQIPPLRDRQDDIPLLVHHFVEQFGLQYNRRLQLTADALDALVRYPWPGNVRELENLMERLVVTIPDEGIERRHLPEPIRVASGSVAAQQPDRPLPSLKEAVTALEEELLRQALRLHGSVHGVARALGLDPSTASRKMRKLKIY